MDYNDFNNSELVKLCHEKDAIIEALINAQSDVLNKDDIKEMYKCEDGKALKILRLMFQMGFGNKIGKEYYVSRQSNNDFLKSYAGKEVLI